MATTPVPPTTADPLLRAAALRSIAIMADGDRAAFDRVIADGAVNHEAASEPPAARVGGPAGFHATALWLRGAFADLGHRIDHVVTDGDLVVVDTTMSGRHVGPFAVFTPDGDVDQVWAPTGRTFAVKQTHWLRVRVTDGQARVTEHWAVRDDLGQGRQLGWVPPTPLYLLRCARAKRRALRTPAAVS
ncbi:ester cyclase [Nakamurella flava]|uniref:Ester cyclase n=1 Tax=Nakamurella flava TaxID=2576308 RepID=A0A4U6QGV5_9ACTN|nr:ester cyclase [Nakamurella flava]TKV59259.1 ester cyclase [Nakamurella flava]